MQSKQTMKLKDIKNSYFLTKQKQDRKDLWLYYVARRISFYPTWLFLKLGISANQATYISMITGIIGCGLLAFGDYSIRIVGALLVSFWIVLDCVDGNIARFKNSTSNYGEFLDALSGYIMNVFLFLSVGIGAFNYPESSFDFINQFFSFNFDRSILIILGAWSSFALILPRLVFHKFTNIFSQSQKIKFISGVEPPKGFYCFIYGIARNIVNFSGFLTPILLLTTVLKFLSAFILFYAMINTVILIVTVSLIVREARRLETKNS